jgi:putative transposase
MVRYHPEDLSRLFVSADGKTYVEATFADLRRPRISLWDQRQARKALRAAGSPDVSEALIFRTIEQQRQIVARAAAQSRQAKRSSMSIRRLDRPAPPWPDRAPKPLEPTNAVNYDKEPEESDVEVW